MDIEKDLQDLERAFNEADKLGISPILALKLIDNLNADQDSKEYERIVDDLYTRVLKLSYNGDSDLMARSLLGYICSLNVKGAMSRIPKPENDTAGRPASEWGEGGEGKLAVYAAVEFLRKKKAEAGLKLKIKDAIVEISGLNPQKPSEMRRLRVLQSAYSQAKAMVINAAAQKIYEQK
jgi:hypothetical protein